MFYHKIFNEDNSENKEASILRLKSELLQNDKFLNENAFTKKDLILLCQTLKLQVKPQQKKDEIISVVVRGILETQNVNLPGEMQDEQAGPSGINLTSSVVPAPDPAPLDPVSSAQSGPVKRKSNRTSGKGKGKYKGKGKGKRKKTSEETQETDEKCVICNLAYSDGEEWICCDVCSLWYHRDCAQLQDDNEWHRLSEEGQPFVCPMCQ